jgi:hypothetical protein
MSLREHPVWEEELMPYVDGQLDAAKASEIAQHLETCGVCTTAVADARGMSQQMTAWKVEDFSEEQSKRVLAELRSEIRIKQARQRWAWWTPRRIWAYGLGGGCAALVIVAVVAGSWYRTESLDKILYALGPASTGASLRQQSAVQEHLGRQFELEQDSRGQQERDQQGQVPGEGTLGKIQTANPSGPMIIRAARLIVLTKDFDGARARIEAVVQQSQGYLDQLTARGEVGSGKALSATLRLPADRIEAALSELRKIGQVREESQNSSDVTSQYVDLQARLNNARNTEQRLVTLQRERTGKLPEVVDVEREISRVREEIERMQAQQKDMNNKVQYATIQLEVSEEYRAAIEPAIPSAGTRLHNAMIDGYHGALESVLKAALVALLYGPVLLLWSAVLLPVVLLARHVYRVRLG